MRRGFAFMCMLIILSNIYCEQQFRYEKLQNYGLGNRAIPNYRRINPALDPYPEPLPTPSPEPYVRPPYRSIYQGVKQKGDTRIYNKIFDYKPKPTGHHVGCEAVLECKITHLAIETEEGVPILMRGGVGYNFFTVIIRAEAGVRLKGRVKAYCRTDGSTG